VGLAHLGLALHELLKEILLASNHFIHMQATQPHLRVPLGFTHWPPSAYRSLESLSMACGS
jgi:hypothetical protein